MSEGPLDFEVLPREHWPWIHGYVGGTEVVKGELQGV